MAARRRAVAPATTGLMGRLADRLGHNARFDIRYRWPLATPEEFFSNPHYCGSAATSLWPRLRLDQNEACKPQYNEAIFGGSTSTGKSWRGALFYEYKAYELLSLEDMHGTLGLDSGSPVYICMASTSRAKARKTAFAYFRSAIRTSPWFKEHFPCDPDIETQVAWPDQNLFVEPIVSAEDGPLGYNLIGLLLDEINELDLVRNSVRAGSDSRIYDAAEEIYEVGRNRQFNRFFLEGARYWPTIVLAGSSERESDFQNRRRTEVERLQAEHRQSGDDRKDPRTFISWHSLWDAKPKGSFSSETFRIEVGDKRHLSRLLKDGDEPRQDARIITPPISFHTEAKRNLERFLRRTAGIAISGIQPLIVNRTALFEDCVRRPNPTHEPDCMCDVCAAAHHPYSVITTYLTDGHVLLPDYLRRMVDNVAVPRVDPLFARTVHIDTASRQDCLGFCIGHPTAPRPTEIMLPDGRRTIENLPAAYIDMILQVRCPPERGAEIPFEAVVMLIFDLVECGIPIKLITMDSWETTMLRQRLLGSPYNFLVEFLSIDTSNEPYFTLRAMSSSKRLSTYYYEPAFEELIHLEIDPDRRKIDHPTRGTGKDCSDAMAGVVWNCVTRFDDLVLSPTSYDIEEF